MEPMTTHETNPSTRQYSEDIDARIREKIDDWAEAVRTKDLDRVMKSYSKDVVSYDMMPPLQTHGPDTLRSNYQQWFEMTKGPITSTQHDVHIECDGNLACAHSLNHSTFETTDGEKMDMWIRWTSIFKKTEEDWLVVHEHCSVPIDMEMDKPLWDLKPEGDLTH